MLINREKRIENNEVFANNSMLPSIDFVNKTGQNKSNALFGNSIQISFLVLMQMLLNPNLKLQLTFLIMREHEWMHLIEVKDVEEVTIIKYIMFVNCVAR